MIIKIFATLFTGIGGHYLNRRWDRAILFLSLFTFYSIFCWIALRSYLFSKLTNTTTNPDQIMQQFQDASWKLSIIYLSGITLLWLLSTIVTVVDLKKIASDVSFKWTKSGKVAASLTTLLSFILLIFTINASVSILKPKHTIMTDETEETSFPSAVSHNFYEYIYMGGSPSEAYKLPSPPEGSGLLKGRITYDGQPAEAVLLHIVLNSKYRASNILTNLDGMLTVKLPVGDYKINSIQTESWQKKPDGAHFSIYYGGESKLTGNHFEEHNRIQSTGYPVTVGEDAENPHINIVIKPDIELIWPNTNKTGVDATISDTIQWHPYPSASKYFIKIQHLRRKGTTTYYEPITSQTISGQTSFPLSSLRHVQINNANNPEYAVALFAFSEDGTLLGEASDTFRGGTFILTDGNAFVEDKLQNLFDQESGEDPDSFPEKMAQIAKDRNRIDAVTVLIEENMLSEAGTLLEKVNSKLAKGEKEVLAGYLFALKGNCSESKLMFEKALAVNPDVCIPDSYKYDCE